MCFLIIHQKHWGLLINSSRFKDEGLSSNDFAETIFVAGAYIGQIMVLHSQGTWIKQEDAALPTGITMMPIVIKLPDGTIVDPILKAYKRFQNGKIDDLTYFYHVFTGDKS
jgi:hypothetical protein